MEDISVREPVLVENLAEQFDEPIHLSSTCHGFSRPGISGPALGTLVLGLPITRFPKEANSFTDSLVQGRVKSHRFPRK